MGSTGDWGLGWTYNHEALRGRDCWFLLLHPSHYGMPADSSYEVVLSWVILRLHSSSAFVEFCINHPLFTLQVFQFCRDKRTLSSSVAFSFVEFTRIIIDDWRWILRTMQGDFYRLLNWAIFTSRSSFASSSRPKTITFLFLAPWTTASHTTVFRCFCVIAGAALFFMSSLPADR